jgi:hypothetical protein
VIGSAFTTADLVALFGYQKPSVLAKSLTAQGIAVVWGKDGPVTTIEAINKALGALPSPPGNQPYGAQDV